MNATTLVTIAIDDLNEVPHHCSEHVFELFQGATLNTLVGILVASDQDTSSPRHVAAYSILNGNTRDAFAIDSATGAITVTNPLAIDPEFMSSWNLSIQVSDGGGLTTTSTIVVN